jgi:hypothetical protein
MTMRLLSTLASSLLLLLVGCAGGTGDGMTPVTCGDGELQTDEQCEAFELRGETCISQGFTDGTLACDESCTLDTSGCSICGNGVQEGNEACDGDDLGDATCASLGYPPGELSCEDDCSINIQVCEGAEE